jgi:outer membrane protein
MAKIQAENANEDLLSLKRQIKIEIKQGYLNLVAAIKQLDVSIEKVKSASENRKANIAKYNLGSGTILNLLQADRDYTQALNDRINAKYQFYKLRDQLINSLGKLNYKKYE